jgi:predicted nucleic acid-binding protein
MRLVLDASVAVAAAMPTEPTHAASRARVERALQGLDVLVVPSLFVVEVSGALARLGFSRPLVRAFVEPLCAGPHEVVTLGTRRAGKAARVASWCKLRGADASYVWLLGPTKSGKTRHVPLTPALADALGTIKHLRSKHIFCNPDGSPLTLWQLHERLEGACRRAGLRRIRWHHCRHSFASQLTSAGVRYGRCRSTWATPASR